MSSTSRRTPRPRPTRPSASAPSPSPSRRPLVVVAGVIAVIVIALGVALAAGSGDDTTTSSDTGSEADRATDTADGLTGPEAAVPDDTPASASGAALPPLPDEGSDPAVGTPMPVLSGTGMDGSPVTIPATGRPTMVVFVAHWCPHCQAEVPVVQQWVDDGGLPAGVDLVAVSTAADPRRPNHPPAEWLRREGWTAPVLVDGDGAAATAAGLTAFPFFVGIDGAGDVVGRTSGELSTDQLSAIAADVSGGAS